MPLFLYYRPSFSRSLRRLGAEQKRIAAKILKCLFAYYEHDCSLTKAKEIDAGFFYKQLQKPYYEAGVESSIRIVLRREGQRCIAVLVGNHDQIKQLINSS